jgi:hypothetical protein
MEIFLYRTVFMLYLCIHTILACFLNKFRELINQQGQGVIIKTHGFKSKIFQNADVYFKSKKPLKYINRK